MEFPITLPRLKQIACIRAQKLVENIVLSYIGLHHCRRLSTTCPQAVYLK
jgi:hypothetical protein